MLWLTLSRIFSTILALIQINRMTNSEKDLEIIILRHQFDVMVRLQSKPVKPNRAEKMILSLLTRTLKQSTQRSTKQLSDFIRIVKPETVIRWHQELVRKKWTYDQKNKGGRPPTNKKVENLIVRLAQENARWGYARIQGELKKLGTRLSITTVRNILNRHSILPAPVRYGSIGWRELMGHYRDQLLACDFFTVETIFLKTLFVFVFIELGSRKVYLASITSNPDGLWVAQQARQFAWHLEESSSQFCCLIRDNDSKYTTAFNTIFESQHINIIPTPFQAPNANGVVERWVRTVRQECLDHILIVKETHLRRVLDEFIDFYNSSRPHQSLNQQSPIPRSDSTSVGSV